jgi:hypothetical protein
MAPSLAMTPIFVVHFCGSSRIQQPSHLNKKSTNKNLSVFLLFSLPCFRHHVAPRKVIGPQGSDTLTHGCSFGGMTKSLKV